jgi:hypothetical protein
MGVRVHRKRVPLGATRTVMRSHGCRQAGQRIDPSRDRGRPWGFMDTGKQAYGCTARPAVVHPCGPMNTKKRAQGRPLSPDATTHGTSWPRGSEGKDVALGGKAHGHGVRSIQGCDGKGAPLRGPRPRMRPHRRADRTGGARRSRRWPLASAVFDIRIDGKHLPIAPMVDSLRAREHRDPP